MRTIKLPTGYYISAPDNMGDEDAIARARIKYPEFFKSHGDAPDVDAWDSIKRGSRESWSLMADILPGMIGKAFGNEDYYNEQMAEAAAVQQDIAKLYPQKYAGIESVMDESLGGNPVTRFGGWLGEGIAELFPSMVSPLAAGAVGRALVNAVGKKVVQNAVESHLQKTAAEAAAKELSEEARDKFLLESLPALKGELDPIFAGIRKATKVSDYTTPFIGSGALTIPESFVSIKEDTGQEDLGTAFAMGTVKAALDSILPAHLFDKVIKSNLGNAVSKRLLQHGLKSKEFQAAAKKSGNGFWGSIGKEAGTGFLMEGTTEAGQEVADILGAKIVDENYEAINKKNLLRVLESGLLGGVAGGGVSGAVKAGSNILTPLSTEEIEKNRRAQEEYEGLSRPEDILRSGQASRYRDVMKEVTSALIPESAGDINWPLTKANVAKALQLVQEGNVELGQQFTPADIDMLGRVIPELAVTNRDVGRPIPGGNGEVILPEHITQHLGNIAASETRNVPQIEAIFRENLNNLSNLRDDENPITVGSLSELGKAILSKDKQNAERKTKLADEIKTLKTRHQKESNPDKKDDLKNAILVKENELEQHLLKTGLHSKETGASGGLSHALRAFGMHLWDTVRAREDMFKKSPAQKKTEGSGLEPTPETKIREIADDPFFAELEKNPEWQKRYDEEKDAPDFDLDAFKTEFVGALDRRPYINTANQLRAAKDANSVEGALDWVAKTVSGHPTLARSIRNTYVSFANAADDSSKAGILDGFINNLKNHLPSDPVKASKQQAVIVHLERIRSEFGNVDINFDAINKEATRVEGDNVLSDDDVTDFHIPANRAETNLAWDAANKVYESVMGSPEFDALLKNKTPEGKNLRENYIQTTLMDVLRATEGFDELTIPQRQQFRTNVFESLQSIFAQRGREKLSEASKKGLAPSYLTEERVRQRINEIFAKRGVQNEALMGDAPRDLKLQQSLVAGDPKAKKDINATIQAYTDLRNAFRKVSSIGKKVADIKARQKKAKSPEEAASIAEELKELETGLATAKKELQSLYNPSWIAAKKATPTTATASLLASKDSPFTRALTEQERKDFTPSHQKAIEEALETGVTPPTREEFDRQYRFEKMMAAIESAYTEAMEVVADYKRWTKAVTKPLQEAEIAEKDTEITASVEFTPDEVASVTRVITDVFNAKLAARKEAATAKGETAVKTPRLTIADIIDVYQIYHKIPESKNQEETHKILGTKPGKNFIWAKEYQNQNSKFGKFLRQLEDIGVIKVEISQHQGTLNIINKLELTAKDIDKSVFENSIVPAIKEFFAKNFLKYVRKESTSKDEVLELQEKIRRQEAVLSGQFDKDSEFLRVVQQLERDEIEQAEVKSDLDEEQKRLDAKREEIKRLQAERTATVEDSSTTARLDRILNAASRIEGADPKWIALIKQAIQEVKSKHETERKNSKADQVELEQKLPDKYSIAFTEVIKKLTEAKSGLDKLAAGVLPSKARAIRNIIALKKEEAKRDTTPESVAATLNAQVKELEEEYKSIVAERETAIAQDTDTTASKALEAYRVRSEAVSRIIKVLGDFKRIRLTPEVKESNLRAAQLYAGTLEKRVARASKQYAFLEEEIKKGKARRAYLIKNQKALSDESSDALDKATKALDKTRAQLAEAERRNNEAFEQEEAAVIDLLIDSFRRFYYGEDDSIKGTKYIVPVRTAGPLSQTMPNKLSFTAFLLRHLSRGSNTREDIVQNTILKIMEMKYAFDPEVGNFEQWVAIIGRNAGIDESIDRAGVGTGDSRNVLQDTVEGTDREGEKSETSRIDSDPEAIKEATKIQEAKEELADMVAKKDVADMVLVGRAIKNLFKKNSEGIPFFELLKRDQQLAFLRALENLGGNPNSIHAGTMQATSFSFGNALLAAQIHKRSLDGAEFYSLIKKHLPEEYRWAIPFVDAVAELLDVNNISVVLRTSDDKIVTFRESGTGVEKVHTGSFFEEGVIHFAPINMFNPEVGLHEIIHALTVNVMNGVRLGTIPKDSPLAKAVIELSNMRSAVEKIFKAQKHEGRPLYDQYAYAFTNDKEFLAYLFTDLGFKRALGNTPTKLTSQQIPSKPWRIINNAKTMLSQLWGWIREIFGVPKRHATNFEKLMRVGETLLNEAYIYRMNDAVPHIAWGGGAYFWGAPPTAEEIEKSGSPIRDPRSRSAITRFFRNQLNNMKAAASNLDMPSNWRKNLHHLTGLVQDRQTLLSVFTDRPSYHLSSIERDRLGLTEKAGDMVNSFLDHMFRFHSLRTQLHEDLTTTTNEIKRLTREIIKTDEDVVRISRSRFDKGGVALFERFLNLYHEASRFNLNPLISWNQHLNDKYGGNPKSSKLHKIGGVEYDITEMEELHIKLSQEWGDLFHNSTKGKEIQKLWQVLDDYHTKGRNLLMQAVYAQLFAASESPAQAIQAISRLRLRWEVGTEANPRMTISPYIRLMREGNFYVKLTLKSDSKQPTKLDAKLASGVSFIPVNTPEEAQEYIEAVKEWDRRTNGSATRIDDISWMDKNDYLKQFKTVSKGYIAELFDALTKQNFYKNLPDADRDALDQTIWDTFVSNQPEASIAKMLSKREGFQGYQEDLIGAVNDFGNRVISQVPRLLYGSLMEKDVKRMEEMYKIIHTRQNANDLSDKDKEEMAYFAPIMRDTVAKVANLAAEARGPQVNFITRFNRTLSWYYYLALSPAAASLQVLQTPFVTLPWMAGHHGWAAASKALAEWGGKFFDARMITTEGKQDVANGLFSLAANPDLTDVERRALSTFRVSNKLLSTHTSEATDFSWGDAKIHKESRAQMILDMGKLVSRYLFHNGERFNREVSAMAAFSLEYKKQMSAYTNPTAQQKELAFQKAIDFGIEVIDLTHGDYSYLGTADIFRKIGKSKNVGWVLPTLLIFKQFAQMVLFAWVDVFRRIDVKNWLVAPVLRPFGVNIKSRTQDRLNLTDAEYKQYRQVARRQLAGLAFTTWMFTGLAGFPFMGALKVLTEALLGDDDDPFIFDAFTRDFFQHEIISHGPLDYITGIGFSSRMELSNMLIRDPKLGAELSPMMKLFEQFGGPVAGLAFNAQNAYQKAADGYLWRGFETALPISLRNILKASRYASEGARNIRGAKFLNDVSGWEIAMQAVGWTPERFLRHYEKQGMVMGLDSILKARHSKLLHFLNLYAMFRDYAAYEKTLAEVYRFNIKHPAYRITSEQIIASRKRSISRVVREQASGGFHLKPEQINDMVQSLHLGYKDFVLR